MKLTLAFSPCPNDTFIFDAIVHNKIDTMGLDFHIVLADVEQLNKWAFEERFDITKLSFNAFTDCVDKYALLDSGSAIGRNCGPLLIRKPGTELNSKSRIGIPGRFTTANMLLGFAFPKFTDKKEFLFSKLESKILYDEIDAGVIIHENRFTYQDKGLEKVIDLGQFWQEETGLPIPLGGVGIRREVPLNIQKRVEKIIRKSIEFAFINKVSSNKYVESHAQEMSRSVIDAHIKLYVNNFSISLSSEGREAIQKIFEKKLIAYNNIFVL